MKNGYEDYNNLLEEIIAENFPKLGKKKDIQVQEA